MTAVLCKLMESFLRDHVMKQLINNNLLSKKQHGFISGRSTVTQLLKYLDKCAQIVATGKEVDVMGVYTHVQGRCSYPFEKKK